jgi:hypothetical protein
MPKYIGALDKDGQIGKVICCGVPVANLSYIEISPQPDFEGTNMWMGKIVIPDMLPLWHSTHIAENQASINAMVENQTDKKRYTIIMNCTEFSMIPRGSKLRPGEKEYDISSIESCIQLKLEVTGEDILTKLKKMRRLDVPS